MDQQKIIFEAFVKLGIALKAIGVDPDEVALSATPLAVMALRGAMTPEDTMYTTDRPHDADARIAGIKIVATGRLPNVYQRGLRQG